jgi:hypothetical protein
LSEEGILGAGSQRINFPEEFYTGEKTASSYPAGVMPQTTGGLANLAGLDVNQFTSGPGYNQQMVDMIFAARAELDRMGKDRLVIHKVNHKVFQVYRDLNSQMQKLDYLHRQMFILYLRV